MTRRFTQRNLHAALLHVNDTEPLQSPLLAVFREDYAGTAHPSLGSRDRDQLKAIQAWVEHVAKSRQRRVPQVVEMNTSQLLQASFEKPVPLPGNRGPRNHGAMAIDPAVRPASADVSVSASSDPFDPEGFNLRASQR